MDRTVLISLSIPELQSIIIDSVDACLKKRLPQIPENNIDTDRWMDIDELRSYHPDKPSRATVYAWTHNGLIPYHRSGKKLRFFKSEIDTWLLQGKRKSVLEIHNEAANHIKSKTYE
ncbi:MAG: helix-turn-helix domain-containing protein [Bacteroidia bacterium]|nr:helix-turn-helix domain-containing protein [Bacteroidia bacterium]